MGASFSTSESREGSELTVVAVGDVDLLSAPLLDRPVTQALDGGGVTRLVLDLRKVTFLASSGLAVLAEAHDRCDKLGVDYQVVVREGSAAARALAVTRLDTVFEVERVPADR
ncbi:hypothetical protein BJP25_09220 [Actinokineospora bangkokensis]|uniref:Anti-sigma factor antagonist n=1 Tax=Actinokineospora bangkokensis TaxID=1193682 RepID=A0A1Q9LS31_9PSEU|nr:hypothetical protein BJP25_09220 [Actinokineospora bangkokensis]